MRKDTEAGYWLFPDAASPNAYLFVKPLKPWPAWVPKVIRTYSSDELYRSYYDWKDQATAERFGREQAIEEAKRRLLQSLNEPVLTEPAVEKIVKIIRSMVIGKNKEYVGAIEGALDDDDVGALETLRLVNELTDARKTCEQSLAGAAPEWLAHMDRFSGKPWRAGILHDYLDKLDRWPRRQFSSLRWNDYPSSVLELVSVAAGSRPYDYWTAISGGLTHEIDAASASRLEGIDPRTETFSASEVAPYAVDLEIFRITVDGKADDVPPEAARMAKLLLEANGEWVPMSKNDFSKPSKTRKDLPAAVQAMIETDKGKGYRLRPNT